jgi:hypothetical protein
MSSSSSVLLVETPTVHGEKPGIKKANICVFTLGSFNLPTS